MGGIVCSMCGEEVREAYYISNHWVCRQCEENIRKKGGEINAKGGMGGR